MTREEARTFIACVLDVRATERIAELARAVRVHAEEAGAHATWVRRENLHVSIRFLGDVSVAKQEVLARALAGVAKRHRAFDVEVGGVGSFPPHGRPKVLFARITNGEEELASIARDVDEALAAQGFPAEEGKKFRAHVTIARVKKPKSFARMVPERLPAVGPATVASLTLFTSDLTPSGPVYRVVADLPLE